MMFAVAICIALSPSDADSHRAFAAAVRDHTLAERQRIVATYDAYLTAHPADAHTATERCRFMELRADDDEADPGAADCAKELYERFPNDPEVVRYHVDASYGTALIHIAGGALQSPALSAKDRGYILSRVAEQYSNQKDPKEAAKYARQALAWDPDAEARRPLATQLHQERRYLEEINLLSVTPRDVPPHISVDRARRLADVGAFSRAQWLLDLANAPLVDPLLLARILQGRGDTAAARALYAEHKGTMSTQEVLTKAFLLELAAGDRETASASYDALRDLGWRVDPVGSYRLQLQWAFPFSPWQTRDLSGLAGAFALFFGIVLLPGLWIIPAHYWSLLRRTRTPENAVPSRWRFRHAWWAHAGFLLGGALALYLFAPQQLLTWITGGGGEDPTPPALARYTLATIALSATLSLTVMRASDWKLLGPGRWATMHCLTSAAIALLVVLFSGFVSNRLLAAGATGFDLQKLVRSTATTFGVAPTLLLIALLVPIVEELVFRAALLDAYTRHMRFGVANTLQALLFAAAHLNPAHSAQLFVLGFCSGLLRQRSRGLLASIALHAFNNAIAVVLTLSAAQVQYNAPPRPFNHLPIAQCAGKTAERKDVSALNALVWEVATSKEASRECLLTALEAQDEVLYQVTEPSFLDTQATLLHRLGRQEEAIDLQRVVIERLPQPITFSQLDRFLPNALTVYGDAKPEQIALSSKGITFTQGYPYGVEVYARSSDGGLLRATFGRGHLLNYDFDWKADAAPTIVPAVMLIDARGVDGANPGDWSWHYEPHDPTVDTYP